MPRASTVALLVASFLIGSSQAQRAGGTFHGNAAGPRFAGQHGFLPRGNVFPGGRHGLPRHFRPAYPYDSGSFFLPYFEPLDDEYPAEAETPAPVAPAVLPWTEEVPHAKPLVIEVPGAANATAAKVLPPTVFVLANGERMETRRFVLTASNLSVSIDRKERTVPVEMLDIDATVAANRERGIDLRIPLDRNEISLSF